MRDPVTTAWASCRCFEQTSGVTLRHLLPPAENRIIFLAGLVEDGMAALICAQLLHLEAENPERDQMYINSPGGVVTCPRDLRHHATSRAR